MVAVQQQPKARGANEASDVEHGGEHTRLQLGVALVLQQIQRQPHGHGVADKLEPAAKYWEDLRTWARGRNWRIDSIKRMSWRIEVDEDEDPTYIPDWNITDWVVISDPVSENI